MALTTISSSVHQFKYWFILISVLQSSIACFRGADTYGVTSPSGEFQIIKGDTLTINCTLNKITETETSKNIRWHYNGSLNVVDYRYVTILDERSAQLNIENMNLSDTGKYGCYLESNGKIEASVCNNGVIVAARLQKPNQTDFNCISKELTNMTCTWKTQYTGIKNTWELEFRNNGGISRCPQYLYNADNEAYGCYFAMKGGSSYPIQISTFYFTLKGKNSISDTSINFMMDHYQQVIAPLPENVVGYNSSENELRVEWNENKKFRNYKMPIVYRVGYKSEWDQNWTFVDVGSSTKCLLKNLIPNANYSVLVRSKIEKAEDVFEMWSQSVNVSRRVRSTAPTSIAQMSSSGFDDVNVDLSLRNITIFWKPVHPSEFKGSNFRYIVNTYSVNDPEFKNLTQTVSGQMFLATFSNLKHSRAYKFTVRAANDEGEADKAAEIYVAKTDDKLADVTVLRAISFGNGNYQVTWKATGNSTVTGYAIFYCESSSARPDLCRDAPGWTDVDRNVSTINITLPDNDTRYRFAVSARGPNNSSGLVWSKCTTQYDGVVRKIPMKRLKAEGARKILVSWDIDCSQQYGTIDGFKIEYCISDFYERKCKDNTTYEETINELTTSYMLDNLFPNTFYSVSVSAKHNDEKISEAGDPQYIKTDEAAPENPPHDFKVRNITNKTITVAWSRPETPNGIITRYLIECKNLKYQSTHGKVYIFNVNDQTSKYEMVLNGSEIRSFTNYSISIKACVKTEGDFCSNYSSPISVLTHIGVPGTPEKLSYSIKYNNAIVQWNPPPERERRGLIDYYILTIESAPKGEENPMKTIYRKLKVNTTLAEVSLDCSAGKSYWLSVQAVNSFNGELLMGNISSLEIIDACNIVTSPLEISLIACGGTIAFVLMVFGCFYLVKYVQSCTKKRANLYKNVQNFLREVVGTDLYNTDDSKMNGGHPLNNNHKSPHSNSRPSEESRSSASSQSSTKTTMSIISETYDIEDLKESSVDQRCAFHSQQSKDSGHDSDSVSSTDSVFTNELQADMETGSGDHNVQTYHLPHNTEETIIELHLNPSSLTSLENGENNSSMTNYSQVGLASNYVAVNNVAATSDVAKVPTAEVHAGYSRVGQMIPPTQPNEVSPPSQPNVVNRPAVGYVVAASFQTGGDPKRDAKENLFPNGQSNVRNNVYLDSRQFEPTRPEQGSGYVLVDSRPRVIAS